MEFDLALRWHGVLLVSGSPLGRLAPVSDDRKSSSSSDSMSVPCDLPEIISSMKENMVDANVELPKQPCDLWRYIFPLSVTTHDGGKVTFVNTFCLLF